MDYIESALLKPFWSLVYSKWCYSDDLEWQRKMHQRNIEKYLTSLSKENLLHVVKLTDLSTKLFSFLSTVVDFQLEKLDDSTGGLCLIIAPCLAYMQRQHLNSFMPLIILCRNMQSYIYIYNYLLENQPKIPPLQPLLLLLAVSLVSPPPPPPCSWMYFCNVCRPLPCSKTWSKAKS